MNMAECIVWHNVKTVGRGNAYSTVEAAGNAVPTVGVYMFSSRQSVYNVRNERIHVAQEITHMYIYISSTDDEYPQQKKR